MRRVETCPTRLSCCEDFTLQYHCSCYCSTPLHFNNSTPLYILITCTVAHTRLPPAVGLLEPTETSKQPIRTRYLGHMNRTGYQPIRDQYFMIRLVPVITLRDQRTLRFHPWH
eukprot:sb/3476932/